MTASLFARALWHGCRHVLRLRALPLHRRLLLLALKAVVISAYWRPRLLERWRGVLSIGSQLASTEPAAATSPPSTAFADLASFLACSRSQLLKARCKSPVPVVVVPAWIATPHQAAQLQRLAAALVQGQALPPAALIVVDDCSPIPVAGPLSNLCAAASPRVACPLAPAVLVHRLPANRGPAAARNVGLLAAAALGASVVLFLDADCQPAADWVAAMLAAQAAAPGLVGGCTVASRPGTPVGMFHDAFGTLNGRRAPDGSLLYAPSCNLSANLASLRSAAARGGACARETSSAGGSRCSSGSAPAELLLFDESFRTAAFEDVEFCVRARKAGVPISYAPSAMVQHEYDYSLSGLVRQFAKYGAQEPLMCAKHSEYAAWLHASADIPALPLVA